MINLLANLEHCPITEYDYYSRDALVGMLLEKDGYIEELEDEILLLKAQIKEKSEKDFNDNKEMVSNLLIDIVEGVTNES